MLKSCSVQWTSWGHTSCHCDSTVNQVTRRRVFKTQSDSSGLSGGEVFVPVIAHVCTSVCCFSAVGSQPSVTADAAALQLPDWDGEAEGRTDQLPEGVRHLTRGRRQVRARKHTFTEGSLSPSMSFIVMLAFFYSLSCYLLIMAAGHPSLPDLEIFPLHFLLSSF